MLPLLQGPVAVRFPPLCLILALGIVISVLRELGSQCTAFMLVVSTDGLEARYVNEDRCKEKVENWVHGSGS